MRRFSDYEGREWDAVVGRESWGTLYALFVPVGSGREEQVRQAMLEASDYGAAQMELAEMDESRLRTLLDGSEPKEN